MSHSSISQEWIALWSNLKSHNSSDFAAALEKFNASVADDVLLDLRIHPTNAKKLYTNGFLSGRVYEVDVLTGQCSVLSHMTTPHGLLVTKDALYATELTRGRVRKYDFATREVSNAFPSNRFNFPARLLGVDESTFLVTEPALGRILKLSSTDGHSWQHQTFAGGMVLPDGVTWGAEGTLLVAAWSEDRLGGQLYVVNANTGDVQDSILQGDLDLPTGIRYLEGKIYVAEMGPLREHQVSVLSQDTFGNWVREHTLPLAEPTGLDIGRDSANGHAMLYVAEGLTSRIWKYDLDDGYAKTLVTKLQCARAPVGTMRTAIAASLSYI